jgi:5-formyltetrahydrofolate cyclo-ligase
MRARRAGFSAKDCADSSRQISATLQTLPVWRNARTVHTYIGALPGEVLTLPLIRQCWAEGRSVIVPVAGENCAMRHQLLTPKTALARTRWGGLEPVGGAEADPLTADVVLVPGVAFDRMGNRLGMGGGFYDCFLAALATPTIALAHAFQIVDTVPVGPSDRRVHYVVTPKEVIQV